MNADPAVVVTGVSQTWWNRLCDEAGLNLVRNDSWSGSTICYTGYDNFDCSRSSSFVYRLKKLIEDGFFAENKIDKVFLFGGTNDSWAGSPLGEEMYGDWEEADLYSVRPAICRFIALLRETLPEADLYCLINTDLKPEITSCMENACEKYGATCVTFDYIDKVDGHPTIQGMNDIKNGVLKAMN